LDQLIEPLIALVALASMEIVLGIDNIVFIAILTGRLPAEQQALARRMGLGAAMVMRLGLLLALRWILGLTAVAFELSSLGLPASWLAAEVNEVSWRDLILLAGGLFLVAKSVHEIHIKMEGGRHEHDAPQKVSFVGVLAQVAVLDIVFSLDSVITAVGMVNAEKVWGLYVMMIAIVLAVVVMLIFAGRVSAFIERHPTVKILALSFLILIGVMLIAEGAGTHVNKGYIYFAMAFALLVEVINIRVRANKRKPTQSPSPTEATTG